MSTTAMLSKIRDWVTTQQNIVTLTAAVIAILLVNIFQAVTEAVASSFLLLTVLIGVSFTYRDHWSAYDQTWKAVVWVLIVCAVTTIGFATLYVVGTVVADLPSFIVSLGAFVLIYFGVPRVLSARMDRSR